MPERRLQGCIHAVLNNLDKGMQVRFRDLPEQNTEHFPPISLDLLWLIPI